MASAAFLLGGCSGDDGKDGKDGLNGTGASAPVKVADLTPAEWSNLSFDKDSGIIGVPTINSPPVVNFKVTSNGKPVVGLPLANMSFAIAKLLPSTNGAPSQWINYNVITDDEKSGKYPSVEKDGVLVDNGDGTYQYTFKRDITKAKALADALVDSGDKRKADLGDLTYDPALTHRLVVGVSARSPKSTDWAYSMKTPYERVIDFIPASGKVVTDVSGRDVISGDSCLECHSGTKRFAAHHATRQDPRYCMVCHNEQIKYGLKEAAVDANSNYDGTNTNIINGFAVGNFPTLVHKIHMGTKLSKTGYNFENAAVNVPAMNFDKVKYPQDIRNCTKCHKDSANADNWMNAASRATCGSCHDNINFVTGANSKAAGKAHFATTSDSVCVICHNSAYVKTKHALPANADVSKRTMQPTVTDVKIDDATGKVTAYFTVTNNDQPVTSQAGFIDTASGGGPYPQFTLTKLVNGADGATKWVSYTNRFRTKTNGMTPVLQASSDTAGVYADVDPAKGQYSYTFELNNSSVQGDIKKPFLEANVDPRSAKAPVLYAGAMRLPLPADYAANLAAFDASKTHRVTMALFSGKMKKAGIYDFVPNGAKVTTTRNIVTMEACNVCHAGKSMHRGYDIELCVACHTYDTKDSMTGQSVDLQHFVHKLHMGRNLPSVKAGGEYRINSEVGGTYDFTNLGYPGAISNCRVCHVEGTGAPANAANWRTTPTANACITCHDGTASVAHATQNANTCVICHAPGRSGDTQIVHQ